MRNNNQIKIDQALHGYEEGHCLLASSRNISKDAQRIMVVLSDMSGPSMVPGFDSYLTGYPLYDEEVYAFAKTWYAPEMKRPGCVWTHTLLIKEDGFREIHDLAIVCNLFRRPSKQLSKHLYENQIIVGDSIEIDEALNRKNSDYHYGANEVDSLGDIIRNIIFYLYGDPDSPCLLLPALKSTTYERIILNLWSQQWPELRQTFAFCTGSLSNRLLNGKNFDLQIIPAKSIRQFKREMPDARILRWDEGQSLLHPELIHNTDKDVWHSERWINSVALDLLCNKHLEFRKYLWEVGMKGKRSSYVPLVKIYNYLEELNVNEITVERLLAEIKEFYKYPNDGIRLKRRIFGPFEKNQRSLMKDFDESDLLRTLAVTDYYEVFSSELLNLRSRACDLWSERNNKFIEIVIELIGTDINPLGEEILLGAADAARSDQLLQLSKKKPGLVFVFAERNPCLASDKHLWMGDIDHQRELLDHLVKGSPKGKTIDSIITAMLDANAGDVIESAYKHWGKSVINALLGWFDERISSQRVDFNCNWLKILRMAQEDSLYWLEGANKPHIETVSLISSQLDPNSETVRKFGTVIWLKFLDNVRNDLDYNIHRKLAEFLLPFSLNKPGPGYEKLAKFSFKIIHDALARDDLSYSAWLLLDPLLPHLPWYRSWDKCERLRRGMQQIGVNI